MKTCPRCGAENRVTATECRLCATPIGSSEELLAVRADTPFSEQMPPTNIVSGQEPLGQHAPSSSYAGHVTCPICKAVNEASWVFCNGCGAKLTGLEPAGQQGSEKGLSLHQTPEKGIEVQKPQEKSLAPAEPGIESARQQMEPMPAGFTCPSCKQVTGTSGFYCSNCGSLLSPAKLEDLSGQRCVLQLITEGGQVGEIYHLPRCEMTVGRVEGDLTYPHDGYMSGRHASVLERNGHYFLVDQNSRNGTFIRITGEVELKPGDMFLIGKQLFRFERIVK